jgi:hypothetical protein
MCRGCFEEAQQEEQSSRVKKRARSPGPTFEVVEEVEEKQ